MTTYKNSKATKGRGNNIGTGAPSTQSIYLRPMIMLLLAILVWLTNAPILKNGFLNWDDVAYVLYNPDITQLDFKTISHYFSSYFYGNYHPFTMVSYTLEYSFFKEEPLGYHVVSLLMHLANTLLVFVLFDKITKGKWAASAFIALLFGIHPMHLESVAWISERKDLLYTFFLLLSLIYYSKYCEELQKRKYLALIYMMFIFSLLSKGQAVILPILMVLFDYLHGREFTRKTIVEKIPFFLISLLFGIIAILAQKQGSTLNEANIPVSDRFFFNSFAFLIYLFKTVVPVNLSGFYEFPYSAGKSLPFYIYLAPLVVILLIVSVLRLIRKNRPFVFGFMFFALSLAPLLLLTVGKAFMAERYSYIPYLGIFYLLAVFPLSETWALKIKKYKGAKITLAVLLCLVCAITTYSRTSIWKSSYSFWTDVTAKYPKSLIAREKLAMYYYLETDSIEGAINAMEKAAAINPGYVTSYRLLGLFYHQTGDDNKAVKVLDKAIELDPTNADHYFYRGNAWFGLREYTKAVKDYTKAIVLDQKRADLWVARGAVYMDNLNEQKKAIADFSKALVLDSADGIPWLNLAIANYKYGDYNKAIHYAEGTQKRGKPMGFYIKALSYYKQGEFTKSREEALLAKQGGIEVPDSLMR
ncbi:MAG: tetratricopeptide repeat protein [Bacteroidales bacterium]